MDDFPGLLARDFGYKPQGKSAPMAPPRTTTTATSSSSSSSYGLGSGARASNSYNSAKSAPIFDDHDRGGDDLLFSDVFSGGGPSKYSDQPPLPRTGSAAASPSFDYDILFKEQNAKSSSLPVFDKPVYDEDIFDGLPGIKSASPSAAAASPASSKFHEGGSRSSAFDDLFADLVKKEAGEQVKRPAEKDASPAFDDLLQGFGRSSSPGVSRSTSESKRPQIPSSDLGRTASDVMDDPFASLNSTSKTLTSSSGLFTDPLEEISKFSSSGSAKVDTLYGRKGVLDDLDPLENLGRPIPPVSTEIKKGGKDRSPLHSASFGDTYSPASNETYDHCPVASAEGHSQRKVLVDDFPGPSEPMFDIPATSESHTSAGRATSSPSHGNAGANDINFVLGSENASEAYDDIWLTVSEVPLFTQPTTAPPPSRPPPPRPPRINKPRTSAFSKPNSRRKVHEYSSSSNSQPPISARAERTSVMDELDDFATGRPRATSDEHADVFYEDVDTSSAAASAAAMKEAMDKAEAKFRQMREREYLKTARSKEAGVVDQDIQDMQQRELRERQERMDHEQQQREEEEREKRRLEKEREREEKEREQRARAEREREQAREAERARENGRHAVERATREARERAAIEARARAERAAADKVAAEARQRAERAAVQRAQAEARERAAANARERAEKVAAEARERANAEAREKEAAERSAALKAEADARTRAERAAVERAAAEARQRAAAAARANQQRNESSQKNENDLESFFSSRASSAPRPRAATSQDPFFDTQSKGGPETPGRTPVGSTTNMRKASSATNIVDDLSSIFGAVAASAEFQEVEGETEDRRRARMDRQHRTQERAAKALAEKNQRDLQVQREQAERDRIGETLDFEIKRWAAGKEGNLRALLSTMQYVLWPECGWQPVSLTELIAGASVKKAYRKATLCIHPDKVQQKGATLQQKYIAEKVFDLLKEAWNKFNSEELF